ncbi:MAG: ABC transporter permease [Actinomycetales bacterium]|nr:ABC transporter permease [Actinomycetales bacterium]
MSRTRSGPFVGTWTMLRFALRRDRIILPAWVIGLVAMVSFSVAATKDLYPDAQSRIEASDAINATAALVALYGKVYDPTSLGALSLIKMTAFGAALISVVFVFLIVRHTRTEEESGRLELLVSGVVGRSAPLAAALLYALLGSAALGLLTAAGLLAVGLPAAGSAAFGLAWALSALVFGVAAGVAAQLTVSHRGAIGLGLAAIALAYTLRAVGDLADGDPGWLSWLSPIGWSQQIRPFAGDRWWVSALPLIATAILVPVAFALRSRRDLGSGLIPDRLGPATGRIDGLVGLTVRLQRAMLVAWLAAAVVMGFVLGSVAENVSGLLDSPQMRQYLELLGGKQMIVDAFLAAEVSIFGIIVGGYAIASVARLRAEESSGHADLVLSTATTRMRWALSDFGFALLATGLVLIAGGAAIGLGHGVSVGDPVGQVARMTSAAVAHIPAAWVMAALVLALFGWLPRAVPGAWGLLAVFVVLGEFGSLWKLADWVLGLSPFAHSPTLPGEQVAAGSLIGLLVVGAAIAALGLVGWRRRDLAG